MPASLRRTNRLRKAVAKPEYLVSETPKPKSPAKKAKKTKKAPPKKKQTKKEEVYTVEKVLEVKRAKGKRISCLIKWEGYEETTWEPITYLNGKAQKDARELLEKLEPKKEEEADKKEEEADRKEEADKKEEDYKKEEESKSDDKKEEEAKSDDKKEEGDDKKEEK